ncbi:MAG: heme-copper oxidase subunit III [Rhizonema sp. PD38]|nr:heme-copper oxidase subunit III [Rhizonema sp. PD38]
MDVLITSDELTPTAIDAQAINEKGNGMFGMSVFLLSESIVFLSFFATYIMLRTSTPDWYPAGVSGLELLKPTINTVILVSSSGVIYLAERALDRNQIMKFRVLLLTTALMGTYFLYGQAVEWSSLTFGLTTGSFGSTFYLLTGFHGLHVFTGLLLQLMVLIRSLTPDHATPESHFGFSATSLFWHFVDIIWIILFALVYLWR